MLSECLVSGLELVRSKAGGCGLTLVSAYGLGLAAMKQHLWKQMMRILLLCLSFVISLLRAPSSFSPLSIVSTLYKMVLPTICWGQSRPSSARMPPHTRHKARPPLTHDAHSLRSRVTLLRRKHSWACLACCRSRSTVRHFQHAVTQKSQSGVFSMLLLINCEQPHPPCAQTSTQHRDTHTLYTHTHTHTHTHAPTHRWGPTDSSYTVSVEHAWQCVLANVGLVLDCH